MSAIIEDVSKGKQEEKISVFPALLGNEIEHHTVLILKDINYQKC